MNSLNMVGRLVADPELRTTPQGLSVTTFRFAVNKPYNKNAEQQGAYFFTCVAWRNTAEFICRNFKKGDMMGISGMLTERTYIDQQSGAKRNVWEILVEKTEFVGGKSTNKPVSSTPNQSENEEIPEVNETDFSLIDGDDDLPF